MAYNPTHILPRCAGIAVLLALLATGCTIAKPRTDDPLEKFNRKMYVFNDAADKAVIRPVAVTYRKLTNDTTRRLIANFFANVKMPITIVNDVLQVEPKAALRNSGRFVVNTTVGILGLFDPASELKLTPDETDFGVTLARWGVPEGPYLVIPLVGPTTARDIWRMPVDQFFDPLYWYGRRNDSWFLSQYSPQLAYLVTLRSRGIDAEGLLEGIYDPYVFYRDAYRQRRLYEIYHGEPPDDVIEHMQGVDDVDIDELLQQQHEYEQRQQQPQRH
ncbi:MAG: VacJ family lipoprotein [Dokdonella sp.]|uniref:MlaA family lipoprotein n=1 Tax=Dokdonella sp. TaxID=2291710 RepID=UPI0025C2D123|nr:VacJ family lipoprotein [Dokdonella sp.]MBX3701426.1 VacJ family lipoprotein [Dokdonella sp.]